MNVGSKSEVKHYSLISKHEYFFLFGKGTKEECEKAAEKLERSSSSNEKQWSSAETKLSDNDESDMGVISRWDVPTFIYSGMFIYLSKKCDLFVTDTSCVMLLIYDYLTAMYQQ